MYDLMIIGAGPAGITASVYAARKRINTVVITGDVGGQAAWSGDIENYTGYQFITGPDLTNKFEEHMEQYKLPIKLHEMIDDLAREGDRIVARTRNGSYSAKAAIIATGKLSRELGVPGEKEFKNKGVSYCATCDGPVFAGKDVAVIGGGNSALDAALQLIRIGRKVYLINIAGSLTGDPIMREKVEGAPNVTVMNKTKVTAVLGDKFVSGITVCPVNGGREEACLAPTTVNVQGVFVEIGLVPSSGFVRGVRKNDRGEIMVNARNETDVPGIFAAGDVTDVVEKQIIIAAGEGSKACLSAFKYLSRLK
ncbi:MAG: FAD-dependent oxidoreductase [Candidatus Omnitrophica bacterium]|nr:FAD-dependent oxidoreductase [Candidatus Omnitrophota bacterium]